MPTYSQADNQVCPHLTVRRSLTKLTQAERLRFFDAHRRLNDPNASRPNRLDYLVHKHGLFHDHIHEGAIIFPWHRAFLAEYQHAIHRIDPLADVPYWEWSDGGLYPERQPVFQAAPSWLGGNGQGLHNCVQTGAFANMVVFYTEHHFSEGVPQCLRRQFDKGEAMSTWTESRALRRWMHLAPTYAQFREFFEPPHWLVHTSIGGDMDSRYAPNDLLFFLHHAYMDKLWDEWMQMEPTRYTEYNGELKDGTPVHPDDYIAGFDGLQVKAILDPAKHATLCYVYA
ncbi:hypothetical protein H4R34_002621 [Dimargaris verticillata]|uniref:Tyrosinase copper-binding domain-containing protein n=1 Tax=Dimargaris verticillata TaxID=2761393 RepID=A0A9W8B7S7_9FUNG|nr:hypothetical protein H4R34_002621 [Dimargaris verticillata]